MARKNKVKTKTKKTPFTFLYILLFIMAVYFAQMFLASRAEEISYSQFRLYLKNGYISECIVSPNLIRGHYKKLSADGEKEEKFA